VAVKKDIRFRVYLAFTGICLLGIAIVGKALYTQVSEGAELRKYAKQLHIRHTQLPAERGNIYTEQGQLLCSTIPQFDVHIDFSVIKKDTFKRYVDTLSLCMSTLFKDGTPAQYKQYLVGNFENGEKYCLLKRNLPYYEFQTLRSFPIFKKGKRRGGLIEDLKTKRINPYGILAYRTIGLYRDNSPSIGLEKKYNESLKGEPGSRLEQKQTGAVWMPIEGTEIEPQNGKDVVTTIDIGIQSVAEYAMLTSLQKNDLQYGTCIVMEVATGKIRAMVNLGLQKNGTYAEDLNRALVPTEPGSTFKLMTLLSLLNDKYVNINTPVNCLGGAITINGLTIHDSHSGLGILSLKDAFAHSSNVAMSSLGYKYYASNPKRYLDHLRKLHLHERTGIDLLGEGRPRVKNPKDKDWSGGTLPSIAYGYEVLVSPLHTCMVYNAVANNGKMMRPYLVSEIREYGKTVKKIEPIVLEESIGDTSTIRQAQECLKEVVISGTATNIKTPFYGIAGKTGTAQVADAGITYKDGAYQGSFVGYFPADNPKYTIAVVMRTKKGSNVYYGGTIAGPVFKMISDKVFTASKGWSGPLDSLSKAGKGQLIAQPAMASSYMTIFNRLGTQVSLQNTNSIRQVSIDTMSKKIVANPAKVYAGYVPDVSGLGLKDAVYLLEKEGMRITIKGKGKVLSQSVPAGTKINKGQAIMLLLS
jgi:cell division protein FtsI (penicillin-binding protein 3)